MGGLQTQVYSPIRGEKLAYLNLNLNLLFVTNGRKLFVAWRNGPNGRAYGPRPPKPNARRTHVQSGEHSDGQPDERLGELAGTERGGDGRRRRSNGERELDERTDGGRRFDASNGDG